LKSIISTVSSIIDETEIVINADGFEISAMDPSRICLLKLTIAKENFDLFDVDLSNGDEYKLELNLQDMDKIMSRANSSDTITLSYKKEQQKLTIQMSSPEATRARTFSLALLDIEIEEVPMDNLLSIDYPNSWIMDPDFLQEALKDAEIYSEILNTKTQPAEGLIFNSSGQIGEMEYFLGIEDLIDADFPEQSKGAYSLSFLKAILKLNTITEKLEISLKTDHPLKMNFTLLEGGKLNYFLAPRVEETEFDADDMDEF
jgi:proliferating cell nuclear antigen